MEVIRHTGNDQQRTLSAIPAVMLPATQDCCLYSLDSLTAQKTQDQLLSAHISSTRLCRINDEGEWLMMNHFYLHNTQ